MGFTGIDPLLTGGMRWKEGNRAVQVRGSDGARSATSVKEVFETP